MTRSIVVRTESRHDITLDEVEDLARQIRALNLNCDVQVEAGVRKGGVAWSEDLSISLLGAEFKIGEMLTQEIAKKISDIVVDWARQRFKIGKIASKRPVYVAIYVPDNTTKSVAISLVIENATDEPEDHTEGDQRKMKKMVQTLYAGEFLLHKQLWQVVIRQIERAENDQTGAFYDDLVAMVFVSHALEAYMNFVGDRLDPVFWKDERSHFRATGFAGKVKKVIALCGLAEPDRKVRPYATVWALKTLRDMIAHPKPVRFSQTIVHPYAVEPHFQRRELFDGLVTHDAARRAVEDIRAFIGGIHSAAQSSGKISDDDLWFWHDPLEGMLGYAGGNMSPEVLKRLVY